MSAIRTASGKAAPANGIAAPRLNATAEAGAMVVIDWNKTPGRPIAFGRSLDCPEDGEVDSTAIQLLLLYPKDRNSRQATRITTRGIAIHLMINICGEK